MLEPTIKFRWTTTSPEPHSVTMRNQLEPVDVFVEVEIPVEEKYLVNYAPLHAHRIKLSEHRELQIKAELSADIESAGEGPGPYPENPILTLEGMRYVISQLQLSDNNAFELEVEDEEEWEETISESDDEEDWSDEDESETSEDEDWDEEWE